jgi:hypothetical protein
VGLHLGTIELLGAVALLEAAALLEAVALLGLQRCSQFLFLCRCRPILSLGFRSYLASRGNGEVR